MISDGERGERRASSAAIRSAHSTESNVVKLWREVFLGMGCMAFSLVCCLFSAVGKSEWRLSLCFAAYVVRVLFRRNITSIACVPLITAR